MKDYSAETGAALADEDQTIKAFAHAVVTPATRTPSPGTFATIALDRITPSLTNPPKTSASEAQAQIAAAMQAEEKTEPGADAQGIEATASGLKLAVGARVKVLPSATGRKEAPWIGKKGTVSGRVGPEAWDVTFEGKVAKPITGKAVVAVQSFHVTELEVVE